MKASADELGLRRALSGPMLPLLVAAMAFLAALAMAGWVGTASLACQWREGAGSALMVQVPRPGEPSTTAGITRLAAVTTLLGETLSDASVAALTDREVAALLRPWLGAAADHPSIPLPTVIVVRMKGTSADLPAIRAQLDKIAPGTLLDAQEPWMQSVAGLADNLWACALLTLMLVAAVAIAVIAVATRYGLAARREAIEILHGLGATDGFIAGRFARRVTLLAGLGGLLGVLLATPVLMVLAKMTASLTGGTISLSGATEVMTLLPPSLWAGVGGLPIMTALIGFLTVQGTVRRWLRRLP